jgi:hypothetical protein
MFLDASLLECQHTHTHTKYYNCAVQHPVAQQHLRHCGWFNFYVAVSATDTKVHYLHVINISDAKCFQYCGTNQWWYSLLLTYWSWEYLKSQTHTYDIQEKCLKFASNSTTRHLPLHQLTTYYFLRSMSHLHYGQYYIHHLTIRLWAHVVTMEVGWMTYSDGLHNL